MQRTSLSTLGEFGLIDRIAEKFQITNTSTVKGIGDDAAVLRYGDTSLVVTTDLLIEGVHYDLRYVPLKHLGYKAVTVNLSDVCAMNAKPKQITVSIGISNKFYLEAIEEIYEGIRLACVQYGVDLVGGDTSTTKSGSMLSITAIGEATADKIVYRHTANAGDLICVSGDLGGAYAGLQVLEREQHLFDIDPSMTPVLKGYEYIVQRQLKPEARKDVIEMLAGLDILPTAMIDISDGLSSEILHIGTKSGKGAKIYESKIPIADETEAFAKELQLDPNTFALNGGEDYELLFTIKQSDFPKLKNNPDISVIGHITEHAGVFELIADDGTAIALQAQGWKNFAL
jgi:thiamine-monophosphate kinase